MPPLDPTRLIIGAVLTLVIGVPICEAIAPEALAAFLGGAERIFVTVVFLLLGPFIFFVSVGVLVERALGRKAKPGDVLFAAFALPFSAFMAWLFFF